MKVLVIGQGGREHAIVRALRLSPSVSEVHCISGSDGIAAESLCHDVDWHRIDELNNFAKRKEINLIVIGPEGPLSEGLADQLREKGWPVFGPGLDGAKLESSKITAKEFMLDAGVPTAHYVKVMSVAELRQAAVDFEPPYVLKADGLAAGKGVYICQTFEELMNAGHALFEEKILGEAGASALLEQCLQGWELSQLIVTNGKEWSSLPLAQDYKRLNDFNLGPNTGGMGTIAPLHISKALRDEIDEQILNPIIKHMLHLKMDYRGVLYVGLMITDHGPKVLEFNARFGDPETQVIMPLLDGDWAQVMLAVAKGQLPDLFWKSLYTSCVVLAAPGYPESPLYDLPISGDIFYQTPSSYFLHAGTRLDKTLGWVTKGGRVLNAIGIGSSRDESLKNAYAQIEKVDWSNKQFRRDIGKNFQD